MLVKFQTGSLSTVTLFDDVAVMHIRRMEHSGTVLRVLPAEGVPIARSL